MNNEQVDKRNYDVASISQSGKKKRANHIQSALNYDHKSVEKPGKFIKVFSDMILAHKPSKKSYI
jgi:hypothetical protein